MKRYITRRITTAFIAFVLILTSTVTVFTNHVFAQNPQEGFYNSNTIMFYDPYSCTAGANEGTSELVGNDNLEKILRYYVGKGLSLIQASGIAGNYQQESSFNPAIIQGGAIADENYTPQNGVGFGIAQWTWTSRQQPLVDLGKSSSRPVTDLSLQLDYSWWEMENQKGQSMDMNEFKATTTPEDAAYVFHRDYEVSADSEAAVKAVRGGNARNIYEQFKAIIPDGSTSADDDSGSLVCTGNGEASEFVGDDFVIYDQYDPKWQLNPYGESTIGAAGCGPAAMAMIITAFGTTVTPAETAAYGAANGTLERNGLGGSKNNVHEVIGGHWGLKSTKLPPDVAKINQALRDGALILTSGTGPTPFTDAGHFIVIRGVTGDGKWMIGDSNGPQGKTNSEKEWDPGFLITNMHAENIWAVTK